MNRRLCVWVVTILAGILVLSGQSFGQALPPVPTAGIPAGAQANAVESASDALAIKKFVEDQFTFLAGSDPTQQSAARKSLIAQLGRGATQAYYSTFSQAWVKAAIANLGKNPPVPVRLNIAIVTATLTDNGMVLDPEQLVVMLVGDREPCVALWGLKAARPLIRVILPLPGGLQGHKVVPAIVDAVKKNGTSDVAGFITTDAYAALVFKPIDFPNMTADQVKPLVAPLVGPILDILEFRLSQLQNGVPAPGGKLTGVQSPGAEKDIGTFLSTNYPSTTTTNQKRIVQDLVNLLMFIGERAPLYINTKDDLAQIRDDLRYDASPLAVIVPSARSAMSWLLQPPPACTTDEILAHTKQVYSLIQADPAFKWLADPPAVVPIEPPAPIVTTNPAAGIPAGTPAR